MTDPTTTSSTPEASQSKTIDIVIANTLFEQYGTYDDVILTFWKEDLPVYDTCRFHNEPDSVLSDPSRIPNDAIVYTHLGANSHYFALSAVKDLTDSSHPNYRPDLRFVVNIDISSLSQREFTDDYYHNNTEATPKKCDELYSFLMQIRNNDFGPHVQISLKFNRMVDFIAPSDKADNFHLIKYLEMLKQLEESARCR